MTGFDHFGRPRPAPPPGAPAPAMAAWLGGTGLLPFVFGAAAIWLAPEPIRAFAVSAVVVYAAVILSFLGGLAWGATSAAATDGRWKQLYARLLAASVVPALVAWGAALLPPAYGLAVMALCFVAVLALDRRLAAAGIVPPWWLKLRIRLSLTVAALLLAAAAGIALKS